MDFRTMLKKKKYAKNVNDEGDPDWGKLKKVDRPDGSDSDPDKQVNNPLFLRHYLIFNIILYICFRCKVREMAESGIYTLSFDEFWIRENRAQKWWLEKTRQIIIALFFWLYSNRREKGIQSHPKVRILGLD